MLLHAPGPMMAAAGTSEAETTGLASAAAGAPPPGRRERGFSPYSHRSGALCEPWECCHMRDCEEYPHLQSCQTWSQRNSSLSPQGATQGFGVPFTGAVGTRIHIVQPWCVMSQQAWILHARISLDLSWTRIPGQPAPGTEECLLNLRKP